MQIIQEDNQPVVLMTAAEYDDVMMEANSRYSHVMTENNMAEIWQDPEKVLEATKHFPSDFDAFTGLLTDLRLNRCEPVNMNGIVVWKHYDLTTDEIEWIRTWLNKQ